MQYFTIQEFTRSSTADRLKIDNTPNEEITEHIVWFIENVLDPLRIAWGSGINISSGFRCKKLNAAVNGSKTSSHMTGYAADLTPTNGQIKEFKAFCREYFKHVDFDQCINEKVNLAQWVHIGAMPTGNRHMFLKYEGKNYNTWNQ